MQGEYIVPLKISKDINNDEFDFMMVLSANKEIVWVNEKAERFFQSDLCVENHIDPSCIADWYNYLSRVKHATIKKSYISLLSKKKKLFQFIAYGMYNHWNETYVIIFRPLQDQISLFELYDKTFKFLDQMHMGAFVSNINGFIFSANETAKYIVPNACQMSNVELFRRFFDEEQFGQYIKLLNRKESFSTDVTCQISKESYHLMYKFDEEFELDVVMIQHRLLKDMAERRTKSYGYLDKQTAASIVHEIRNPITALQGFVELMKLDEVKNPQYLQLMENEIRRMDHLLGGMLHLLKPKVECIQVEINSFLQNLSLLLEMHVKNKNISLVYSQSQEQCYIFANEFSLTQIFVNLIKNSIQAMNANGTIAITFEKKVNNELEICIKDTGHGISKEHLSNLFTPYYTTKEEGTGLGLSVVKKLLEDMGGRIEIRSELGIGTEVYVYLQLAN